MAKLYILTPDQIKSGQRPKTPKDKMKLWRMACLILSASIVIEHVALLFWIR